MAALAQQTVAPDEVVIVLDDDVGRGAEDELRRRYPHAKFATSGPRSNYFAAKNAGAAAANGDIIALLDSDCTPGPEWLEMLVSRFTPGVGVVAGRARYAGGSLAARMLSVPDLALVGEQDGGTSTGMHLNNVAFRRDVLLRHPLDARIRRNGGCYLLFHQLRAAGVRVVYEPRARTMHGFPGARRMLLKELERGYDAVDVYRLDDECVLRGTRWFRRLGGFALFGITARRIVLDWRRLAGQRRQIGISAFALPYVCAVIVVVRLLELLGGLRACAARSAA
jgi:cellulose synthase/poly-beta-1,6-N-acetylglucosamine synthase-like glycosyltransferase